MDREKGGEGERKGREGPAHFQKCLDSPLLNIELFCNFLLFTVCSMQAYCDLLKFFSYALVYIMICCPIIPLLLFMW